MRAGVVLVCAMAVLASSGAVAQTGPVRPVAHGQDGYLDPAGVPAEAGYPRFQSPPPRSGHALELAATFQLPAWIATPDLNPDSADFFGIGMGVDVRYVRASGHAVVGAVRYLGLENICVSFCTSTFSARILTGSVGYAYQFDFARRAGRRLWLDVTPRLGFAAGHLFSQNDPVQGAVIGGDVGAEFNLHVGAAVVGLGLSYEPLFLFGSNDFANGGTFFLKFGGRLPR